MIPKNSWLVTQSVNFLQIFPPISWLRRLPSKLFADAWRTVRERWLCGSFRWVKSLSQVTQRTIYSFMPTTVIIAPLCFIWDHLSSWIPKVAYGLPLAFNFPADILVFEVRRIALKTLSCISEEGNAQAEMFADMFCYGEKCSFLTQKNETQF